MKATILFVAILGLALLVIPMVAMNFQLEEPDAAPMVHTPQMPSSALGDAATTGEEVGEAGEEEATPPPAPGLEDTPPEELGDAEAVDAPEDTVEEEREYPTIQGASSFRILDETTGEIHQVSLRDYVRGAVAAEMYVSFHEEALKAQAVAAHTYALRHRMEQAENPDPVLQGADFSCDPSNRKGYMTEETALEFYGENGEDYWERICNAADSVLPYVMVYNEEPIVAAYHAISAGTTEDASNVWIGEAPYLTPVDSEGDLLAPDYETEEVFTPEELRSLLLASFPMMELDGDPALWFGEEERSPSGYITSIAVGDEELHGKEVRTALDLRSHNFLVDYSGGVFTFLVTGYGHGVGLSQYGADFLARQGYSFDEILEHYYEGITLAQVDAD